MKKVSLVSYTNKLYQPGSLLKRTIWYFLNIFVIKSALPISSNLKIFILKMFGAKVGSGVLIKPNVNIKYPWFLEIGDNVWIGENVWIDNLAKVIIGNDVCLSQDSYLLTGSHNYKKSSFDLLLGEIILEDGVWIGAKSTVCSSVTCKTHSILAVNSVATSNLNEYTVYQGNPAMSKRKRIIE